MEAEQRPFSVAAFTGPSGDPAWKTIPRGIWSQSRIMPSRRSRIWVRL